MNNILYSMIFFVYNLFQGRISFNKKFIAPPNAFDKKQYDSSSDLRGLKACFPSFIMFLIRMYSLPRLVCDNTIKHDSVSDYFVGLII